MSDFGLYFQLGVEHIADLRAFDHMIFVISLCCFFTLQEWKKVLILVTAFTIGHSITLALSILDLVSIDKDLIETLIPITILITCCLNIALAMSQRAFLSIRIHYFLAVFFGLIHGLGFANYLKALLMGMGDIFVPLFSFNVGIEVGQLSIVLLYLLSYFLVKKFTNVNHKAWVISISCIIGITSIYLMF